MKKVLTLFVVAMLLVVTGCGKGKTLECSADVAGTKQKMAVEYDGDKIKKMTVSLVISKATVGELSTSGTDVKALESLFCSTYTSMEGIDCSMSTKGSDYEMKVVVDYKKIDDATKKSLGYEEKPMDSLKEELEGQGYTCK